MGVLISAVGARAPHIATAFTGFAVRFFVFIFVNAIIAAVVKAIAVAQYLCLPFLEKQERIELSYGALQAPA